MSDLEIKGIYKTELLFSTKPNSTPVMQAVFVGINANGEYTYNITSISSLKRTITVNRPLTHDDLPTIYENIMCKPSNLTVSNPTTLNPSRKKRSYRQNGTHWRLNSYISANTFAPAQLLLKITERG